MKVLCAVDGSEFSRWGAEALAALVEQPPEALVLLHVLDTAALKALGRKKQINLKQSLSALELEGSKLLRQLAQTAKLTLSQPAIGPVTKVHTVLAQGPVAHTIVSQAKRRRADLLIVGSRGLSDIQGFLLGSVSRTIVSQAPCPVLVVKRPLPETPRTVLAVDTSKYSRAAADFLRARLVGEATQLTVLSVVPPVATDLAARVLPASEIEQLTKPAREQAHSLIVKFRETFLKDGCAVVTEVLSGHPGQTILQYIEKTHPDLVVVGSRGLTGTERFQLGSVSESVLKYAPCSVLVVRGRHA